jgi:hypothetical protein
MSKKQFEKFLEAKSQEDDPIKAIDWIAKKEEWLASLDALYREIEQWLSEYITSGKIKMERFPIALEEEYLGKYTAEKCLLVIGADRVMLRPIGTLLIGASGRVDMEGPKGTVKFIRTGKTSNGIRISVSVVSDNKPNDIPRQAQPREEQVWKIATPPPRVRFIELTSDSFYDALMTVVNG